MSELSTSALTPLVNGPESRYVIESIDALLRSDVVAARLKLIDGAEECGWGAIAHRLDVAGHALAVDAGLCKAPTDLDASDLLDAAPHEIVLIPGVDTSSWTVPDTSEASALIDRWSDTIADAPALPVERVWSSLAVVAWMVDRAGYPAQVVV